MSLGIPPGEMDVYLTMFQRLGQMQQQSLIGVQSSRVCCEILLRTVVGGKPSGGWWSTQTGIIDLQPDQRREADYIARQFAQLDAVAQQDYPASPSDFLWRPGFLLPGMVWLPQLLPLLVGEQDLPSSPHPPVKPLAELRQTGAALRALPRFTSDAQPLLDCLTPAPFTAWTAGQPAGTPIPTQ